MNYISLCVISVCLFSFVLSDVPKSKDVKCAVCSSLVYEIYKAIKLVNPRKTVEYGSYRFGPDGHQKRQTKKYAGSETHITDLMETMSEIFTDYVQGHHKKTGILEVFKIMDNGKMNPNFGDYDLVQDPDLNKGVQFHCQSIIEDNEEDIIEFFSSIAEIIDSGDAINEEDTLKISDLQSEFCQKTTNNCPLSKDEL